MNGQPVAGRAGRRSAPAGHGPAGERVSSRGPAAPIERAFPPERPQRAGARAGRLRWGTVASVGAASALLALLVAVPSLAAPGARGETPEPVAAAPAANAWQEGSSLTVDEGTHERVLLDRAVAKVAVGAPDALSVDVLSDLELLLLGKQPGRTSLLVWFQDGSLRRIEVQVRRDLSILEDALHDVHPDIRVEMAPDREAVVLSGTVPLPVYARRAEAVARAYLEARPVGADFLTGEAAEGVAEAQSLARGRDRGTGGASVINLIRVAGLPAFAEARSTEEKLLEAIQPIGGERVTVRRIVRGEDPSDERDILVLEGTVRDQTALTRVLSLAYKIFIGAVKGPDTTIVDGVAQTTTTYEATNLEVADDIAVIADESGALHQARGQGQSQQTNILQGFGRGAGATGGGGGANLGGGNLGNEVGANIGRAKALELAQGRILSFIEVEDQPQVRVDIRLYEVNRTRLLSWEGDFSVIGSDFSQPSLEPAEASTILQGDQAPRVGTSGAPPDVQNVAGFLGGRFSNQLQFSGSNWAVDSLISLLEDEGIARGLANTSLSVLSGEVALFQVGGRIPIDNSLVTSVTGPAGVVQSVQFIEFGVRLAVRPLVGEGDFITIDFVPEVSVPDAALTALITESTASSPPTFAFESRLLRTSARLLDGNTLLVGGLDQKNRQDDTRYTPWLAKVPLLGLLFQGFDFSDDDMQVVVLVRPTIVRDPLPDAGLWMYPAMGELTARAIPEPPPAEGEAGQEESSKDQPRAEGAGATPAESGEVSQ